MVGRSLLFKLDEIGLSADPTAHLLQFQDSTLHLTQEPDIEETLAIGPQQYELYQFDDDKYAVELHSLSTNAHNQTSATKNSSSLSNSTLNSPRN